MDCTLNTDMDMEERALYTGQGAYLTGALIAPALSSWIATKVSEKSAVFKERRKAREERQLAGGSSGASLAQELTPGLSKKAFARKKAAKAKAAASP